MESHFSVDVIQRAPARSFSPTWDFWGIDTWEGTELTRNPSWYFFPSFSWLTFYDCLSTTRLYPAHTRPYGKDRNLKQSSSQIPQENWGNSPSARSFFIATVTVVIFRLLSVLFELWREFGGKSEIPDHSSSLHPQTPSSFQPYPLWGCNWELYPWWEK